MSAILPSGISDFCGSAYKTRAIIEHFLFRKNHREFFKLKKKERNKEKTFRYAISFIFDY